MRQLFQRFRKFLIRIKVYLARSASYITMINTAMVLFLFMSNLEKYGIDIEIKDMIIPIVFLGLIVMIIFGFIEDKLGFYSEEQKTTQSRSPYMKEIIQRLERIEQKLEKKR
ncbi:hypothetical protein JXC34_01250 [Candidatus Woesearchaeota archaeon]|nr:hypothetical protein [Candidatus Woesearchaeota archaeon]